MKTLNVDDLQVESFSTELGETVSSNTIDTWCTQADCGTALQQCSTPCIAPSGATDHIRCCG